MFEVIRQKQEIKLWQRREDYLLLQADFLAEKA